jgi:hypothetical protein
MKKELLHPSLVLGTAVAASLLTGCASMNQGYTDINGPRNALAYTTVTDPVELTKWTGDRFLMLSLRGIDTYQFQVPDTGYRPGGAETASTDVVLLPSADNANPDGVGAPGPYQSGSRSFKVIEYRPGGAR